MNFLDLSSCDSLPSTTTTLTLPTAAATTAMPVPIWPAPTTPTVLTGEAEEEAEEKAREATAPEEEERAATARTERRTECIIVHCRVGGQEKREETGDNESEQVEEMGASKSVKEGSGDAQTEQYAQFSRCSPLDVPRC